MDKKEVEKLSYNELRSKCANLGLGGSGTKEMLQEKLYNHTEKKTEEPEEDTTEETKNIKAAQVIDERERVRRTYTPDNHGDDFMQKARTYVETRPGENLEVKIIE